MEASSMYPNPPWVICEAIDGAAREVPMLSGSFALDVALFAQAFVTLLVVVDPRDGADLLGVDP
jgi:hypothetical protein